MGRSNHGYNIYKKYTIDEIYKSLENGVIPDEVLYHERDYKDSLKRVKIMMSLVERDGSECVHCKKTPEYFALGKDKIGRWHLDLYSDVGNESHMLTIDHVHPKSKGGKNELENYQLMCKICNEDKGDIVEGETDTVKPLTNSVYINKKITSLTQQIRGILLKLKSHKLICVSKQRSFTIGNEYTIENIRAKIDDNFETKYSIFLKNDLGKVVRTHFKNFVTKKDFEKK